MDCGKEGAHLCWLVRLVRKLNRDLKQEAQGGAKPAHGLKDKKAKKWGLSLNRGWSPFFVGSIRAGLGRL
jgi:hypothetical protein